MIESVSLRNQFGSVLSCLSAAAVACCMPFKIQQRKIITQTISSG
jgi:hypothetical protein